MVSTSTAPSVSVLMSVYNGERFVREAVESILGQTRSDFEFLIVDDASTDGTAAVLDQCADPRIVRRRNPANLGQTQSLNESLKAARGQFVAVMDADDVSLPERLARQTDFMAAHPEIGVLGTAARLINAAGAVTADCVLPADHAVIRWRMCFQSPIIDPSVMLRREVFRSVGGYNPARRVAQDYDLWQRLATMTRFANLPEPLLKLRKHADTITVRCAGAQFEAAVASARRIMADLLGRDVSERDVRNIWTNKYPTNSEAESAARLILDLAGRCISFASGEEARQIRLDANRRLAELKRHSGACRPSQGSSQCSPALAALRRQAQAACKAGNTAAAIGFLRQGLADSPAHSESLNDLGVLLGSSGRPAEAEACFKNAFRADTQNFTAMENLVDLSMFLNKLDQAAALVAQWTRLRPQCVKAWLVWAKLHMLARNMAGARTALTAAAGVDPRNQAIQKALESLPARPPRSGTANLRNWNWYAVYSQINQGKSDRSIDQGYLLPMLIAIYKMKVCTEIGCFKGFTSEVLGRGLEAAGGGALYSVDVSPDAVMSSKSATTGLVGVKHTAWQQNSSETDWKAVLAKDGYDHADLCYIDGDHSYEGTLADLNRCSKVVKVNGFMIAHDYQDDRPGVAKAVREFMSKEEELNTWSELYIPGDDVETRCSVILQRRASCKTS